MYIYIHIVFSSAKPVTLVDVLGNILVDNELCCGSFQRNWGGPPLEVQILYTFPTPKMGIK